jgi:hypothetical protein
MGHQQTTPGIGISSVLRGFRQFDAPVCVIITYDRVLDGSDGTPFDCDAVGRPLWTEPYSAAIAGRNSGSSVEF